MKFLHSKGDQLKPVLLLLVQAEESTQKRPRFLYFLQPPGSRVIHRSFCGNHESIESLGRR
jgi:hypothetical protein